MREKYQNSLKMNEFFCNYYTIVMLLPQLKRPDTSIFRIAKKAHQTLPLKSQSEKIFLTEYIMDFIRKQRWADIINHIAKFTD